MNLNEQIVKKRKKALEKRKKEYYKECLQELENKGYCIILFNLLDPFKNQGLIILKHGSYHIIVSTWYIEDEYAIKNLSNNFPNYIVIENPTNIDVSYIKPHTSQEIIEEKPKKWYNFNIVRR